MSRRSVISAQISCANNATCFEGIALTEKPTGVRARAFPSSPMRLPRWGRELGPAMGAKGGERE